MRTTTITPKWEWETYPCPDCEQETLEYDGSVKWSHGPRPGRKLATRGTVGFSPRADFEIAHYFHCGKCKTKFYDPVDSSCPRLFRERRDEE